jgi:5'-nucleotidase / UDP-sugar diphosphatase
MLRPSHSVAAGLLAGWLGLLAPGLAAEPVTITLLQVSDWDRFDGVDERGGFARLVPILADERARDPDLLLIHAGDAISPSLLSGFDHGAHMIALLNELRPAAMALGNHEFDFGAETAKARIAEAAFPILNSNVVGPDGSLLEGTAEHLILEVKGFKLGLFGLTTPDTAFLASPEPYDFQPILETATAQAEALRAAGADLVIAVTHTGKEEDRALYDQGAVDIILTGHDHDLMALYNGRVAMMESGAQAEFVGALDLTVERVTRSDAEVTVWRPSFRTIDSALVEPDPEALQTVERYEATLSAELDIEIGRTTTELDSRRSTVRGGEAAIGNLIADAIREAVGADVAITNGGGIRADKLYPAGTVLLRRDILSELPFGNTTVKLEVTGAQLLEALETGVSEVEQGAGRFPQVAGLRFRYDPARPAGSRVIEVTVGGAPLDPAARYSVATNDYMAGGGDGYAVFKDAKVLIDPAAAHLMASQVIDHVSAKGEIAPAVEGRIMRAN